MKVSTLITCLTLSGCLSRTDLGTEPSKGEGMMPLADAAVDATGSGRSAETLAAQQFEEMLVGRWPGRVVNFPLDVGIEFDFGADSRYLSRFDGNPWSEPGYYFVTDFLASGRFAGLMQDAQRNTTATFSDMRFERRGQRNVLAFELSSVSANARVWQIELEKVP